MITRIELQRLNDDCMKLCNYTEKLEDNCTRELADCNRSIKLALRKIIIANEISDRYIICITGLQGTGKTTLVKNFFGLDDSAMSISIGRGERLPVLITEDSSVSSLQMWEIGIEKKDTMYDKYKRMISQDEFVKASKVEDEDSTTMYLEMRIPKSRQGNNTVSFMLLPGYEGKDDYWETLIDFSVKCSDMAVFVLQPSSVSSMANKDKMDKIKNKFGEHLVYVVTHSDGAEDENAEAKKTLGEILELNEEEQERIVCTGSFLDEKKNENWKKQLKTAIERYAYNTETKDSKNAEYLYDIIINELRPAVGEIKSSVKDNMVEEALIEFKDSEWLKDFDEAVKKMRKQYEDNLDRELGKAQKTDVDKLREGIGKIPKIEEISRIIFGDNLKHQKQLEQILDESMRNCESEIYEYHCQEAFVNAVEKCRYDICRLPQKENLPINDEPKSLIQWTEKEKGEIKNIFLDVETILSNKKETLLNTQNSRDIMSAIVELGTIYFGEISYMDLKTDDNVRISKYEGPEIEIKNTEDLKSTKKFVRSVLGVVGIDIVENGNVDFIPKLAEAIKLPESAVTVGAVGCVLLGLVKAGIQDYHTVQMRDFYSCAKALTDSYENIKKNYLSCYNNCMEMLKERVRQYIIDSRGVKEAAVDIQNTWISIKNISNDINKISGKLNDDRYEITKYIKG